MFYSKFSFILDYVYCNYFYRLLINESYVEFIRINVGHIIGNKFKN